MAGVSSYRLGEDGPEIAPDAFVAPGARLIGRVRLGPGSSVWYNAVLRADVDRIEIGRDSNIQDGCVVHVDEGFPCRVGERVTVGHRAILHGCTVADGALVGMGAVLLNGCRIGRGAIVAAGALVPEGAEVPDGMLAMGVPARVVRPLRPEEVERTQAGAAHYVALARRHRQAEPAG
jgi:carbonic anhydrase/acetyltransferase-like protein (isoleucine patch superfamily)